MLPGSSPITLTSPSSKAHQKSGSFAPPALPGLNAPYDPVRLPPWPPPVATLRPLPSPVTGLPRLPEPPFRRAVPTTPADRAGARVDCFPAHAAFPKWQEGRHPHCHFRGLLRLHTRYGPPDCSAAQGDLCHEAPALPVTRPSRSSASRSIDNSPGGVPPSLIIRAFGAHCHYRKYTLLTSQLAQLTSVAANPARAQRRTASWCTRGVDGCHTAQM